MAFKTVLGLEQKKKQTHITHLSSKRYAEEQPGHPVFAKCVQSHDIVIGGEPVAILGRNYRLWADIEQKSQVSLPDRGFEPNTSKRCRTAYAVQLCHRGSQIHN
ncbi:hypothetical protein O3G_MSEX006646 [Manduca sexta]|uniref:Uncharacterized protein n=1 Tax=Manduca sexta TaxID=7130 RepID=A0A922CLS2_MANSE|nr:hypothetical protein O3G_MSEX006646 [Manduca sexta]